MSSEQKENLCRRFTKTVFSTRESQVDHTFSWLCLSEKVLTYVRAMGRLRRQTRNQLMSLKRKMLLCLFTEVAVSSKLLEKKAFGLKRKNMWIPSLLATLCNLCNSTELNTDQLNRVRAWNYSIGTLSTWTRVIWVVSSEQSYKHKHVRQRVALFIFIARLKIQIDIMESWGCTVCKLFVVFFIFVFVVVVFVVLVFIVVVFVKLI